MKATSAARAAPQDATNYITPLEQQTRLLDAVYEKLCEAIFHSEIPPGSRLSVPMLAARFGVSRSPIRDAVQQLVADGIAVTEPRKGVFVADFQLTDAANLLEITAPLEAMAGEQAARNVTDEDIARLQRVLDEQERALQASEGLTYARLDAQFHRQIVAITRNERLEHILKILHNQLRLISRLLLFTPSQYKESLADHKMVLRALRSRDPKRVAAELEQHVLDSRARVAKRLAQEGAGGAKKR